jgi:hypothetical protein
VYLWENRETAETMYSNAWRRGIAERFGAAPQGEYFNLPVIIDNTGARAP